MKISRIEISNFIGISEFKVNLGKINTVTGRVGAGKSSIIEAIQKGFSNKNDRSEVIRHGEESATIFIKTDDGLEIDRRLRSNKSDYLKVKKIGVAVPSTEKYLKQFFNGELFKPLEFCTKSPTEQAKIILGMLEIPWSMDDIATWFGEIPADVNYENHVLQIIGQIVRNYFSQREVVNREIALIKAQIIGYKDELPKNYDGEEWRPKKVADYYKAVADAEAINQKIILAKSHVEGFDTRVAVITAEAETERQAKQNEIVLKRGEIDASKKDLGNKIQAAEVELSQMNLWTAQIEADLAVNLERANQRLKDEYEQKKVAAQQLLEQSKDESLQKIQSQMKATERQVMEHHKILHGLDVEYTAQDEKEVTALKVINENMDKQIRAEEQAIDSLKLMTETVPIEVGPLREAADEVARMQSYLRDYDLMASLIREKLAPREELSNVLTARIDKGRKMPTELLKIAALPIPGITVDGDGLIRIGKTLIDGLSEGEQLELAFRVAKAQAGELKLICLDGWNKINPSTRAWIEQEINEDEFQYLVVTTEDGDLAMNVSDGSVAEAAWQGRSANDLSDQKVTPDARQVPTPGGA